MPSTHQRIRKDNLVKRVIKKYQAFTQIGYVKCTLFFFHYSFKNGCYNIRKILT